MSKVRLLLSTGRVSTQNLASILSELMPDSVIEHEGMGPNYFSRRVLRAPRQLRMVLGQRVDLQRKLISIEDGLAEGIEYVDFGWPVYAWLPYFAERFGDKLTFMHLVRNPFEVAASLMTHGTFSQAGGRPLPFQVRAMVHPADGSVVHKEIAKLAPEFSAFEFNLFHWLELNHFALEQHKLKGFRGLMRYEDLYSGSDPKFGQFLTKFCERDITVPPRPAVDIAQRTLNSKLTDVHPLLLDAVTDLAEKMGYDKSALLETLDIKKLEKTYSQKRLP